ncbi:MAG: SitI3 family protein [Micrococcales bacterium]|nr:SitI3 family protein [Micrococcales bacterium]
MFSYTLGLRTEFAVAEVSRIVTDALGVEDLSRVHERHPGLFVSVRDSSDPIRQSIYSEFLGALSTASLYYSMNSRDKEQLWRAERVMAVSAARLAVETDALAFMTFDLDSLIMRRTDGVLYLYGSFNAWREPEVTSQIPQPWVTTDNKHDGTPPGGVTYG